MKYPTWIFCRTFLSSLMKIIKDKLPCAVCRDACLFSGDREHREEREGQELGDVKMKLHIGYLKEPQLWPNQEQMAEALVLDQMFADPQSL